MAPGVCSQLLAGPVEHDLDDATAVAIIREYAGQRPFPRDWSDAEIVQRLRDAESHCRRAQALELAADGYIALGNREPQSPVNS
jgi:hypothetical protein